MTFTLSTLSPRARLQSPRALHKAWARMHNPARAVTSRIPLHRNNYGHRRKASGTLSIAAGANKLGASDDQNNFALIHHLIVDMDTNAFPPPQSVDEVAQLVKRLYQPGNPQVISQIQEQLQTLQRSNDGWQLADALLGYEDINIRFFGALTFTVKLNNDGSVLLSTLS